MSFGTDHDHRGEYAAPRHDHPELVARGNVADMLEGMRLEMRTQISALTAAIAANCKTNDAALSALETRAAALEAIVTPPLPAGQNRFDAVERKIQLVDQTVSNLVSPTLVTLEGRLDRLEAALDALDGDEDQGQDQDPADVPPHICLGGC